MRVALIGPGTVSVVHLAAIEKLSASIGLELAGVCDSRRDHREFLDDVRPEVVHICTPHDQHVRIATDALERGVHVLLEKPVANTVAEADRLVAAAKDHPDVKIGVCLQNRYNMTSRAAYDLLLSGELGTVTGASASVLWHRDEAYYAAKPWRGLRSRAGGGVLINQAIHTLDLLQWLLGDVTTVTGHAGCYGGASNEVEDTAHLLLDHARPARSVFFATTTNAVDSPVTIEIVAERGTLYLRGDLTVAYADGRAETVSELLPGGEGRSYWGASHELLIADFYRSLDDPEPFWIGPAEALKAQHLIDEIYRHTS
ncbi:Gfo/Idh/MocA family protein [Actinoplanes solisilvae]|uniref:Gfo/Idh/MocA family protein n=1 Tax=Actinoplanes solisilvae TaxID=2486853 RepID=UPI000FD7F486|nr:Gfo/Idh/MocA family oxidoreductase [Actinoplanes solisilvae]